MRLNNNSGRELDATFSVRAEGDTRVVTFESRGPGRNTEYADALEVLIGRLPEVDAVISDVFVASSETTHLPPSERRLLPEGYEYPVDPATLDDLKAFRVGLTAAQGMVGRSSTATKGSGNPTKRIELFLTFSSSPPPIDDLAAILAGTASDAISYWAFCANPDKYRALDAVRALSEDSWTTKGKPITVGDRAIIWQARGSGERRGVIAFAEVIEKPRLSLDDANPFWTDAASGSLSELRAKVRYLVPPNLPLWLDGNEALLGHLPVARARGGTVFRLDPHDWQAILTAAGGTEATFSESLRQAATPDTPQDQQPGQSWSANPQVRRAIERYAMQRATDYFVAKWDAVENVSSRECYDLVCRSGDSELRVEVKGTMSRGEAVFLTANEVNTPRNGFRTSFCS